MLASRTCPVCFKVPIHAGQEVCRGRCRAARSRQRKAATYGDKILKDAKPTTLVGITIPQSVLLRADQVIE